MRARDSTRCAISAAPLMANSMAVIPAPVTGTGSKVPSGDACKSSGRGAWCVLPLRWFWASLFGPRAAASGTFPDEAGCRGSSILLTRHSIQRLFSSRSSALQISKISRARIPSSRICCATTGGTYITRSPSSEYMTCSPYRPSTRFPSSQRRATSTGELVLNRRIPFVIVVLLVLLPGVPVLSLLLQVHRPPRVAVLLPVPLLGGRDSGHDGGRQARESGTGVRRRGPPTRESAWIPGAQDKLHPAVVRFASRTAAGAPV